jgi:glycolate oxidase
MQPTPDIQTKANRALIRRLGQGVLHTDEATRFAASYDNARISRLPAGVIKPRDEKTISEVLVIANRHRIPVTVRGAGSAATGAATPVQGGWVIDLSSWTKARIDDATGMAYVQPGVVTADLNRQAEALGWFYPPDPSSSRYCTIGGNIITNAGGLRAAKYGVTRDYVLGLEGFLPTGEKVRWGGDVRKFVSGLNLRDLWIGSEGMLGVVTSAVLKLIPKPVARHTLLAGFRTDDQALNMVQRLLKARLVPSILEFIDRQSVVCTEAYRGAPFFKGRGGRAILLMEVDGDAAAVREQRKQAHALLRPHAESMRDTGDPVEAESLWEARRTCSQAMYQLADTKLNEDIVVPLRSQRALLRYTLALKKSSGLPTPTYGHAADGNFHVHVMFNRDQPDECQRAETAIMALMRKVVELGGAITGEHGIGLAKSAFMPLQHTPAEIKAMRAVKDALDPNGILNPGKMFEPFPVWKEKPVQVRMPWYKH